MARALFLATRGRGRTSPNPLVGAVVVSPEGIVVGHGAHEKAGGPHAEVHALDEAGDRARGATLYCTLEPCSHTGRTGPCVERIAAAGIARVVAAVEDPNPLVQGRGVAYLRDHGIAVEVGIGAEAAIRLNQPFFTYIRERRPFVILKAAASADGRIAAGTGQRTALTSPPADRRTHRLRAEVDAMGVGSETVLVDDPLLTVRGVYRERPLVRVIFDRRLRTPASARIFSTLEQGPVIMMTSPAAVADEHLAGPLRAAGAELEAVAGPGELRAALGRLADRGVTSLLLEGGAKLHAAFWEAGLVDYVHVYVTPQTLGAAGVPFALGRPASLAGLFDQRVEAFGPDVLIEGYVHRPH